MCRISERQTKGGGLNGRPEKLPDVCYSWWCLSVLSILKRLHWIDQHALACFILNCQVSCDATSYEILLSIPGSLAPQSILLLRMS